MDIKDLECFKIVVESGSILQASKILHIAQPHLSRTMKKLEDELETKLFDRGKKLSLLPEGRLLYERASKIIELKDNTITDLKLKEGCKEILRIGAVSSCVNVLYNDTIEAFSKKHPHINFEISEGNTYQLIELLKAHVIDLAIVRTPFDLTGFNYSKFYSESMVILSKASLDKASIQLEDLNNKPIIMYRRFKSIVESLFKKQGLNLNIKLLCDDAKTTILFASTGIGYAIVPESAYNCFSHLNLNKYVIDKEELSTDLLIINRLEDKLSDSYSELIEYLMNIEKRNS